MIPISHYLIVSDKDDFDLIGIYERKHGRTEVIAMGLDDCLKRKGFDFRAFTFFNATNDTDYFVKGRKVSMKTFIKACFKDIFRK